MQVRKALCVIIQKIFLEEPMFSKKNSPLQAETPNTLIGKGVFLEAARMTGQESVRIDGNYKGEIDIDGTLVLGDTSNITGNIHAKYIVAAGFVDGNLSCDTILHMASTARIVGNVEAQSLIVDEGSQINGKYKIGDLMPNGEANQTAIRRIAPPSQPEKMAEQNA